MKQQPFYMIYVEGGNAPTYKHETLESAQYEAKRLADKSDKKVYILCSVCSIERKQYDIVNLMPDAEPQLPF